MSEASNTNVLDFISELGAGVFIQQLGLLLSEAAQGQIVNGNNTKKSKISIELVFNQMGENEQVIIVHKISKSLPTKTGKKTEENSSETAFFVGKRGVMTITPPVIEQSNQFNLSEIKGNNNRG